MNGRNRQFLEWAQLHRTWNDAFGLVVVCSYLHMLMISSRQPSWALGKPGLENSALGVTLESLKDSDRKKKAKQQTNQEIKSKGSNFSLTQQVGQLSHGTTDSVNSPSKSMTRLVHFLWPPTPIRPLYRAEVGNTVPSSFHAHGLIQECHSFEKEETWTSYWQPLKVRGSELRYSWHSGHTGRCSRWKYFPSVQQYLQKHFL